MKKYDTHTFLASLALAAVLAGPAFGADAPPAPAAATPLALHRALYAFKMIAAGAGTGLNDISGKMYFEQDETCDAWTTEHRFTTQYDYADQPLLTDTSHYVSYESKDGKDFSFNSTSTEDGEPTEELRGGATRTDNGAAEAVYTRPGDLKYDLDPGYFLPTGHTMEIIRHAEAGDHYFSAEMFDGTDSDGPVEIGTFIGKRATPGEIKALAAGNDKIDTSLLTPTAWHIRMAVFPVIDTDNIAPAYEMDAILHDNGVISHAVVDYKDFTVDQKLVALEKLSAKKCH